MQLSADITILGGLQVRVKAWAQRAEPDVGIFSDYIEDFEITDVYGSRGRKPYKGKWLDKRIDRAEHERICEAIAEAEL
mgnify:CR=1 FL=1